MIWKTVSTIIIAAHCLRSSLSAIALQTETLLGVCWAPHLK